MRKRRLLAIMCAAIMCAALITMVGSAFGGTSAQVQVSNVFGTAPLVIADVDVALRSSGSTVVSGTDHTVTFGGQTSITIPAGGLAISDAVAMSVPALSDVAVSMYLPQSTGSSTYHQQGTVTNYIASGDVSGNASLSGAQTTNSYFFLTDLNVQNPGAQGAVVTLGASITDGYASTTDANERWPNDLPSGWRTPGAPSACSTRESAATGCWWTDPVRAR